ncbi:aminopeptidase [Patescibacteria group bacterium]|nr:aminopeptidase [Patescibacteria group bacterium]MBU1885405.1 aminopeptidase [Patescibacteria group bacterium]
MTDYQPSQKILQKYAEVLINCALNSGKGIKPKEVVQLIVPDIAKPLARELQNTVLKAGGHPMLQIIPTQFDKDFYTLANADQLTFFPQDYLKERVKLIDHQVYIIADPNPFELKDIDHQKFIKARDAKKAYRDWLDDKEGKNKFTWTIGLWGVPAKADIVGLSLEDYWQQIIKACFLDKEDPIAQWQRILKMQKSIKKSLNAMSIEWLDVKGPDVNLKVKLGANRIWSGGSGRNIPSFEFFTSPDWRGVEGWIKFNQPLYRYGNVVKDIYLELKNGLVVKAKAKTGNKFLQEMLKSPNANKIGEYSLTDKRMSRITHAMAETLFDENISGPYGNTHLAVGRAYKDCYRGNPASISKKEWENMGFNDSAEHTDIVSTTDRTVTATMTDGNKKIIYKKGKFTFYKE